MADKVLTIIVFIVIITSCSFLNYIDNEEIQKNNINEKIEIKKEPIIKEEKQIERKEKTKLSKEEINAKREELEKKEQEYIEKAKKDVCPYAEGIYDAEAIFEEFDGTYFDSEESVYDFEERYCKIKE